MNTPKYLLYKCIIQSSVLLLCFYNKTKIYKYIKQKDIPAATGMSKSTFEKYSNMENNIRVLFKSIDSNITFDSQAAQRFSETILYDTDAVTMNHRMLVIFDS